MENTKLLLSQLAEITSYKEEGGIVSFHYLHHAGRLFRGGENFILLALNVPVQDAELAWLIFCAGTLLSHPIFRHCALQLHENQWWLCQRYCRGKIKTNLPGALAAQRRAALWLSEEFEEEGKAKIVTSSLPSSFETVGKWV